ncbi:MAG: hypothetical protein HY376_01050 [Candidatus Blackburnbacteria bacterium]|nr:hypothetical protein [Candidatus Blackburnbacteria bacterium]
MKTEKKSKSTEDGITLYRSRSIPLVERILNVYIDQNIGDLKKKVYTKTLQIQGSSNEPLVNLFHRNVRNQSLEWERYNDGDAHRINNSDVYLKRDVYVRHTVAQKLVHVDEQLKKQGYNLFVRSGYRHPQVQEMRYAVSVEKFGEAHARSRFAVREDLSGDSSYPHATGGVVDVEIWANDQRIPMGGKGVPIGTFDLELLFSQDPIHAKAKQILLETKLPEGILDVPAHWEEYLKNRRLLYHVMRESGFYFILGEFWHWGMGDHLSGVAAYLLGDDNYNPWYGLAEYPKTEQ